MSEIKVEAQGLEELQRDFRSLARKIEPKELKPILRKEAQRFAALLLPRTPLGPTGNLRKGVKAWTPPITARHPDAMARAGVRYRIAPHVHLVEYGTKERYNKRGAYRGVMPARHFIMSLGDSQMPGILRRIIDAVNKVIAREWNGT